MRTIRVSCFTALMLMLCSYGQVVASAAVQQPAEQVAIPEDLSHATEFVRWLQSKGLVVQEVLRSHREAMLGGSQAAFIRTEKGVVEVVFFPGEADAEKLVITYSRNGASSVPHRYVIGAQAIGKGSEIWEAASPAYITLQGNWFITTSECELDGIIKRALQQGNRIRRP